jgi:prepilin-type processing-associated H-X9-DG protein
MSVNLTTRPRNITIDRGVGTLNIVWADGHGSDFPLRWLRANCPCATCREQRREAQAQTDLLTLSSAPPPSAEIANAELVGNYAVRLVWTDGHDSGIYAYSALREVSDAAGNNPDALPSLLA